ncbi:MAG: putative manganese transporter [Candidatus Fimenecus sp.]
MITPLHIHADIWGFTADTAFSLILDSVLDTLKTLPFLFAAFLIIEFLEHHAKERFDKLFRRTDKSGPLVGALLGCVPQCGFSVLCANLYTGGIVTLGTLIAVFLSTSDEAVILLASSPNGGKEVLRLVAVKVIIAVIAGYMIDIFGKRFFKNKVLESDLCEHDRCGCEEREGVLIPALIHTVKVFGFLLLFTVILNFAVALSGEERLGSVLLTNSVFQPFLAALLGFIPNCASSVMLTQLYTEGALSFGSVIAGLCTNAGAGLIVLMREKSRAKDNVKIIGILYVCAVIPGIILHLAGI